MSISNNGKEAEKQIQEALKTFQSAEKFDYQRLYDATSARGAFMAQVGDFLLFTPKSHGVIEVKSTQHPTRLSRRAFSDLQRAKLYKRSQAGGKVFVLVWHYTQGIWRKVPYIDCYQAFTEQQAASMDLTQYPSYTLAQQAVNQVIKEMLE